MNTVSQMQVVEAVVEAALVGPVEMETVAMESVLRLACVAPSGDTAAQ